MISSKEIAIQSVTGSDITALQELSRTTFSEAFASQNTVEDMQAYLQTAFSAEKLKEEINTPGTSFYFAVHQNKWVGYLKVNEGSAQSDLKDANSLEVERIYVRQAYLGKGIGQLLFNHALTLAKDKGKAYVWLGVWEKNEKAIRFYKKNGFAPFSTHSFYLGSDKQTDILMKLALDV